MDIKKRETSKYIKVLDKSSGIKIKEGYISSKEFVRKQTEDDEEKPEDKVQKASSTLAQKCVNTAEQAGKMLFIRSKQKFIKQRLKKSKEQSSKDMPKIKTREVSVLNPIKTREGISQIAIKTTDIKQKPSIYSLKSNNSDKLSINITEKGRILAKKQAIKRTQIRYRLKNRTVVYRSIINSEQMKIKAEQNQLSFKKPVYNPLSSEVLKNTQHIKTRKPSDTKIKTLGKRLKIKQKADKTVKASTKTIKTSKLAVKTANKTALATSKGSITAIKTAKNTAFMLKQLNAGKFTVTATKSIAKAIITTIKTTLSSIKALISALIAGGWGLIVLIVVVLGGTLAIIGDTSNSYTPVSEQVNAYEPLIRIYAKKYGIPDYVELIKAVMMQESGGQGNDPMQASECGFNTKYPNTPNGITDPEYSIDVGIQNLASCLEHAKVQSPIDMENIKLSLQGYNFGNGYISWAIKNYGGYSYANAVEFSEMMAKKLGWSNYGDKDYVPHVLRYYPYGKGFGGIGNRFIVEIALSQVGNVGGEPYWSWYGFSSHVEWCACFVSWCADQAGYIDAGIIPKFSACTSGEAWFKSKGLWKDKTYEPKAGDIIFFDWQGDGKTDHVGIVDRVENDIVYTVEGNSGDACKQNHYIIGSKSIYGYGTPIY